MTELDDSAARAAATDPRRSILLQAPAGSGKTTVLIQRMLRLLAEVDAPEQVLAITFTRKAAGEMRARILAALQPSSAPRDALEAQTQALAREVLERSARLGWQLERQPGRLRIQTLDALCQRLAASLPVAARLGGSMETTDDAAGLYEQAAQMALRAAEEDAALQRHSDLWLARVGNDWTRLAALIGELLARRNHWLRHVAGGAPRGLAERVSISLERLVAEELTAIESTLSQQWLAEGERYIQEACETLLRSGAALPPPSWVAWIRAASVAGRAPSPLALRVLALRAVADLALTSDEKGVRRRRVDKRLGFPVASARKAGVIEWLGELADDPDVLAALCRLRRLPDPVLSQNEREALESLIVLLQYAAAQLALVFAETGLADHAAISAAARQALTPMADEAPAALDELDRIHHVLVDEFQDTSIEQFELLERLVQTWQHGEPRSLFLVGDPMQSIYQFREAEVGLFMRAREQGVGHWRLELMALRQNFRSCSEIVGFVNETFATIFPPRDDSRVGAVAYLASRAAGGEGTLPAGVHLHRIAPGDRRAEAARVLEIVGAARAAEPRCSIAVLVANRDHARHVIAELRAARIGVRGVDLVPLGEVPVVLDLMALTRAIASPCDRIAWLAVLRAPWCGLALPALTAWLERDPSRDIAERLFAGDVAGCEPDDAARLSRVCEVYARLAPRLASMSLASAVEAAWLQLGGPLVAAASTEAEDAEAFFVALRLAEARGSLAAADVEKVVERLFAAPGHEPDPVEVMTIHRSKGLEFDCVILPGLGRSPRSDREPLLDWFEWTSTDEQPEMVLAPIGAASEPPGRLAAWLRALRAERREHERARLLYVAATRARRALHLLGETPPATRQGGQGRPRAGTPQATLWPCLGARWLAAAEASSASDVPDTAAIRAPAGEAELRLRRLRCDWRAPRWPDPPGVMRTATAADVLREPVEFNWAGEAARRVGIVVHRELQRWARHGLPTMPDERRVRHWLAAEGVGDDEIEAAVQRALLALRRTLADPRGRWLLDPSHRESHCELALTGVAAGRVQSVVIDRSFVDADGTRWVIDYKTSAHEGGDLESFIASERRRYQAQLARYTAFARELGPEPVRAGLYFPLLARFEEVTADRT